MVIRLLWAKLKLARESVWSKEFPGPTGSTLLEPKEIFLVLHCPALGMGDAVGWVIELWLFFGM